MNNCDIDQEKALSQKEDTEEFSFELLNNSQKKELLETEEKDASIPIYSMNLGAGKGTAHSWNILHGRTGFQHDTSLTVQKRQDQARWLQSTFISSDEPAVTYDAQTLVVLKEQLPDMIRNLRQEKGLPASEMVQHNTHSHDTVNSWRDYLQAYQPPASSGITF